MTKLAQSNIYSASADEFRVLFGDYLAGSEACIALVMSEHPLGDAARDALSKTFDSFGYGADACMFATTFPRDPQVEGGDMPLDAQALFLLVEGLDPICIVCADAASATLLGQAYRTALELDSSTRLLGRTAVIFRNFPAMLATETSKQSAWRLLKSLPKR